MEESYSLALPQYFVTSTQVDSDFYLVKINSDGTTGLPDEYDRNISFEVFPNRFSDVLNLDINTVSSEPMTVEFIDVFGRLVYAQQTGLSESIRIESLSIEFGTYIVLLKKEGKLIESRTIVAR